MSSPRPNEPPCKSPIQPSVFPTRPSIAPSVLPATFLSRLPSTAVGVGPVALCPSKQPLWSSPSMLIAVATLMMRPETRPVRNISSARSEQARSHLSPCSLCRSWDLPLLWPRGREHGSSIRFRESLANAVKQDNTVCFIVLFCFSSNTFTDKLLMHLNCK